MRRRIVKQGSATMTISLPSTWIKNHNLKEGDELEIEEKGNLIELSTSKIASSSSIFIDADKGSFTKRDLSHLYILGYDEITLKFSDEEVLNSVKERLPDCIGFEIIDQSENKIKIKSISSELEGEFDNILNKVFLILKEMGNDVYDALEKKEYSRLKKIKEMEIVNNKFTSFLLRLLSKKGYKRQNRTLQAYDLIQNLERLADEYKYLCENLADRKKPISNESLNLLKAINENYTSLYTNFLKSESQDKSLYKQRASIKIKVLATLEKEPILNHHLLSLLEVLQNTNGSYLALIKD